MPQRRSRPAAARHATAGRSDHGAPGRRRLGHERCSPERQTSGGHRPRSGRPGALSRRAVFEPHLRRRAAVAPRTGTSGQTAVPGDDHRFHRPGRRGAARTSDEQRLRRSDALLDVDAPALQGGQQVLVGQLDALAVLVP